MKNKIHFKIFAITVLLFLNAPLFAFKSPAKQQPVKIGEQPQEKLNSGNFSFSSFAFTENKGQIKGYDGLSHPEVKYSIQQGNLQIFILENGLTYQFTKIHYPEGYHTSISKKDGFKEFQKTQLLQEQLKIESFRVDMSLLNANKNCKITCEGRSEDYINFYNHNVLDVHTFNKIIYHNIYPGIDWVIYTKNNALKYDFILNPGADPKLIKMAYHHQEDLKLDGDGNLNLKTTLGLVTEKHPISFQKENKVSTNFMLTDNIITFQLGKYNANEVLCIDPSVVWATYYGGWGFESGAQIANDNFGNVYLTGYTGSSNNIAAAGHQNTITAGQHAYLVKFDAAGTRLWATYYGGTNTTIGGSCVCDSSNNVYLCGYTSSTINIASAGFQNSYGGGGTDAYLVKFNSNGFRQWATYYGGEQNDIGSCSSIDKNNNIYICGRTTSTSNISSNGFQSTQNGSTDAFLVKFNSNGVRTWATYYGGSGLDESYGCYNDKTGNVYITGMTNSSTNISSMGHQNIIGGNYDCFLAKFNENGSRIWATYYGGLSTEWAYSCVTDSQKNIYITGQTTSTNNISSNGHQNIYGGSSGDGFISKFDSLGTRLWSTYYGGINFDELAYSTCDTLGNLYSVGTTVSASNIATLGTYNGGSHDAFIVKFNSVGTRQWGQYFGGPGQDVGGHIVYSKGSIYISGLTTSTSNIAFNGFQNNHGAGSAIDDAFLVKFCESAPAEPISILGNTLLCTGDLRTFSVANQFNATNYIWSYSGSWTGSSNTYSISSYVQTSGFISVSAQNPCGSSLTQTIGIQVMPSPTVTITSIRNSICIGETTTLTATGANSYSWMNGNTNSTIVISPTVNTIYNVIGSATNSCTNSNTYTLNVNKCLSIEADSNISSKLTVFPNPSNGIFIVETAHNTHIIITNAFGQTMLEKNISEGTNILELSEYSNGIYFIHSISAIDANVTKIIKQ